MNQEIEECLEDLPSETISTTETVELRQYTVSITFDSRWGYRYTHKSVQSRLNAVYGKVSEFAVTSNGAFFNVEFEN